MNKLSNFTDVLGDADEICDSQTSQPLSFSSSIECHAQSITKERTIIPVRPAKGTGQCNELRCVDEIDPKYRDVFTYQYFNLVQSKVIEDALYSDKSLVVCAPTGSGKTVVFEMAVVQLLMELKDKNSTEDYKIIYMAPVKALCTERLTEWHSKFTKLGLMCIAVTGDTEVDFTQLQAYKVIITTPEKWDMLTRRWRDHRGLVEIIKLFLIDEVHILNDDARGPVLEAVVSRMKTIQASALSAHRIEKLQKQYKNMSESGTIDVSEDDPAPRIRFVAVSATVSNPEDVAAWLGTQDKPAVYYKFGDECRPVKLRRIVEGYPCGEGTSIFKFDIILSYKLWPIIQRYHNGKPTLIFCNTRKSVLLTAETLSREITITFSPDQQAKLTAVASMIRNKKLQTLVLGGVGCHHAGMLYEERLCIEQAFRNGDLPILITTTTLAMGVNLPAHLVIIKNTQQYVNGAYQEYSISTVLQMIGRAGRPQFDTEATAVIMTRQKDKARYQALAGGSEPLQSYLHKRLAENLNGEAALGTVGDVAQCVEWLRSTFLYIRAAKDPKRYLGLTAAAPEHLILKKIQELCVIAMNGLSSAGLITMDEACCIASTEAGRLMSLYYLDLATMKHIMKVQGNESLERLVWIICESHELADMHLRMDERRILNALNRNNNYPTIRFPMKGKITTRQMKLSCLIQAILGCLPISDPSVNQEAMKIIRTADRICKCLVAYVTRPEQINQQLQCYSLVLNSVILAKCIAAHLWENSPYVSKQLKGIGPAFSTLLATAGKINFMLLEESHPRDLERIMNKGPPAGNIIRKQISLLPKYQLSATPVDEKTVSVKLLLLNQAMLSENMEHLTAGVAHKSYVIVGDSENHILMLKTFTDKDLISVYDGLMNYEITRKHNFEHKVLIHCISSSFAGIDVQCEYTFTSLRSSSHIETLSTFCFGGDFNDNEQANIQTNRTTPYKDRKRKTASEEIVQSKEKKKRESALSEKIKLLKESFSKVSSNLKTAEKPSENMFNNPMQPKKLRNEVAQSEIANEKQVDLTEYSSQINSIMGKENDHFDAIDDARINNILLEIENEFTKTNIAARTPHHNVNANTFQPRRDQVPGSLRYSYYHQPLCRQTTKKALNNKSNYKFLELLEKNMDLSDEDDTIPNDSGFSKTIQPQIEKYMLGSSKVSNTLDSTVRQLCEEDNRSLRSNPILQYNDKHISEENFIVPISKTDIKEKNLTHLEKETFDETATKEKNRNDDVTTKRTVENINVSDINKNEDTIIQKYSIYSEISSGSQKKVVYDKKRNEIANIRNPDTCSNEQNKDLENDTPCKQKPHDEHQPNIVINAHKPESEMPLTIINSRINEKREEKQISKYIDTVLITKDVTKANPIRISPTLFPVNENNNSIEKTSTDNESFSTKTIPELSVMAAHKKSELALRNISSILPTYKYNISNYIKETVSQESCLVQANRPKILCKDVINNIRFSADEGLPLVPTNKTMAISEVTLNLPSPLCTINKTPNQENASNKFYIKEKYAMENSVPRITADIVATNTFDNAESSHKFGYPLKKVLPRNATRNQKWTDSENSGLHNDNTAYEKKYSFSAEKVDVQTKFTDEYKIRVVRRLKVDLDIKKRTPNFENKDNSNNHNIQSFHYVEHTQNNESEIGSNETFNCLENQNLESLCQRIEHMNEKDIENLSTTRNENVASEKDITNPNKPEEINNNNSPVGENNVKDILKKYSQLIGKNKIACETKITPSQNSSCPSSKTRSTPFKPNRPFKISNIPNLNLSLPSICEGMKTAADVDKQKYLPELNLINKNTFGEQPPKANPPEIFTNPTITCNTKHTEEDRQEYSGITPYQSPTPLINDALDIAEDFPLDQSMFNPKILLRSLKNEDDEIIPPPPEFGTDDISYSYSPEINDNNSFNDSITEMHFGNMQSQLSQGRKDEKTIYEDNSVDLTPSKEIETWILTREGEQESTSSQSLKSLTVMRKSRNQPSNFFSSNKVNSQQGRLRASFTTSE